MRVHDFIFCQINQLQVGDFDQTNARKKSYAVVQGKYLKIFLLGKYM